MGIEKHTPLPPTATPPSIDELAHALRAVSRKGLPVSPDRAPDVLLALRGVHARSINPDDYLSRVKALNQLLTRLLMNLGDGEEASALRAIFGLPAENRGLTLMVRRGRAGDSMGYEVTHFRKHVEPRLMRDLAWLLHDDSQTYTPRTKYVPEPTEISGDTPSLTPADINEQEELVSRIWALVYELRAELIRKARLEAAEGAEAAEVEDAAGTSLWVVARLLARIHDYLERYGDRILHGDAEFRAEGLIHLAGWSYEFTPEEATELRYVIAKTGGGDRERFLDAIAAAVKDDRPIGEDVPRAKGRHRV